MVRSLLPEELVWFLARSFAFLGHADPHGLAQRLAPALRDARREAAQAFVLHGGGSAPSAGVFAQPPGTDDDGRTLKLSQPWFERDGADFARLVGEVVERFEHESVRLDLPAQSPHRVELLSSALAPLGFDLDVVRTLSFDLADTPPLGLPLVLEAWRQSADGAFRELVARSEGWLLSDRRWSWLKRASGPFTPDLWFLASETPDQDPVGYALCGTRSHSVDGSFGLTAVGVLPEYRGSTEMLRRVVLSLLNELAGVRPLGRVETELSGRDPKLIEILRSLGFTVGEPCPVLRALPA